MRACNAAGGIGGIGGIGANAAKLGAARLVGRAFA